MSAPESRRKVIPIEPDGLYEKHRKVYMRSVSGRFDNWRWIMVFLTQALFYGLCWIDWNGRQAVLFHLVERKFYLFGLVLWPQDVFYLAVLLILSAYALFLVTAVGGRLFCGYACPQTVYTEILMWIEAKIEGDRPARMKLDRGPRDGRWYRLKTTKHALWLLISLWSGFTLVGYFTPIRELSGLAIRFDFGPWEWFWVLFYAAFLYMQAGFLREQVCKYMCPYARFQGVMFDPDTLVISYDPERGEPRGQRKKGVDPRSIGVGDCIDCNICVQVCPTGIDIRDGLQMECIACAACIDACDDVMDKMKYPRGLIRYSTENALAKHYSKRDILVHLARPRTLLYTSVLLIITVVTAWSLSTRIPLRVDVLRDRAVLYRELETGQIENAYTLQVMNTTEQDREFDVQVSGLEGIVVKAELPIRIGAAQAYTINLSVLADPGSAKSGSNPIHFQITAHDDEKVTVREKSTFMLP